MDNMVIYDALSVTSKIHQAADFIDMLGLQKATWQTVKGAHGYQDRLYFECISIHFNGSEGMGIWLEMMGQGCRAFETYGNGDYENIFETVFSNAGDMKITRLDVAYDDHDGILDLNTLCNDTRYGNFVSKFSEWQVIEGSKGNAVNHGSMKSDIYLRIYDKAKERGLTDGSHWIRVEIQMRKERAMLFAKLNGDIGKRFSGVIRNYLRYVQSNTEDQNKWRWDELEYWRRFLDNASAISIYEKPGTEYNLYRLENYCYKLAGNATAALIEIVGIDKYLDELQHRGTAPNAKYEDLKRQMKGIVKDDRSTSNGNATASY